MNKEHNISSLPKWAQDRFEQLQRKLDDARTQFYIATQKPIENSSIVVNPFSEYHCHALDRHARVRFIIGREGPGEYIDVSFSDNPSRLYIASGTPSLDIVPEVSNAINIGLTE